MDLYEFKQRHPDADISPFMKKSSEFFRNYITRGLQEIEAERAMQSGKPPYLDFWGAVVWEVHD